MGDNAKDFNDALGVISSIGPAGQKLSSTISDLNKTMPKFEVALNSVNSVDFNKFFDPKTGKDAVEKFIGGLGIDTKGAVAEAMRDSFAQAADTANMKQGEGLSREDRTKKIFDTFNDIAKINSERGKQVLEVFKASEAKAQAIQEAINQSRERQLELELSNADAYETLQKNIAQARGRSMSLAEGDQLRGNRQRILAGNLGGNAKAIGAELVRRVEEYEYSSNFVGNEVINLSFDAISNDDLWHQSLETAVQNLSDKGASIVINGCSAVNLIEAKLVLEVIDPAEMALSLIMDRKKAVGANYGKI
jgi:hypothetical protein